MALAIVHYHLRRGGVTRVIEAQSQALARLGIEHVVLAGTRYRGDFEARFKALVAAIQQRPNPILFIDEIHAILGAGSSQGARPPLNHREDTHEGRPHVILNVISVARAVM